MRERDYFQVIAESDTQEKRDINNHIATLMEHDPHWDTNDCDDNCWAHCNGRTKWYRSLPASPATQQVINGFRQGFSYSHALFRTLREGRGDLQGFRAPISEADFEAFRSHSVIEIRIKKDVDILALHNLTFDDTEMW